MPEPHTAENVSHLSHSAPKVNSEKHSAEKGLPVLCDQRGERCCGVPACLTAGLWTMDPYDEPIGVFEGTRWHMHAEPICADPDCVTYLTRSQVATMRPRQTRVLPPVKGDA